MSYRLIELTRLLQTLHKGIRTGVLDDVAALVSSKNGRSSATPRPGVVKTVAGNTPTRTVKGSEHLYPKDVSTRIVLPFDRTDSSAADLAQGHT